MSETCDLLIRNGTLLDGSGADPVHADVAIVGGCIHSVGRAAAKMRARSELDASGCLVTPGFVDIHTHYDGQVTWESRLAPSSNHGVTTVLMGNCGVGFAPCRPDQHDLLIQVMEGVEDIPEVVMREGIPWEWETFPQYLDFVGRRAFDVDCAAYLPHAALRVYVMGKRAAEGDAATERELDDMSRLVTDAMRAGAMGVATSRTLLHRTSGGDLAPHVKSGRQELLALARGLRWANKGVFQLITHVQDQMLAQHVQDGDLHAQDFVSSEIALLREIVEVSGRPLSFSLVDVPEAPGVWQQVLDLVERANNEGSAIKGQIYPRPIGLLFGLDLSLHPFSLHPSYRLIENLPLSQRVQAMRDPAVRKRILAERPDPNHRNPLQRYLVDRSLDSYQFGDPPNYDPPAESALAAVAARRGESRTAVALDWLLERDGTNILYLPINNFTGGNLDNVYRMLTHRDTLIGLGDGGAHYGMICDASFPTFLLAYWTRDRAGPRIDLPAAVHALTQRNAVAIGLHDRGLIAPGLRADLNVIDYERLRLRMPEVRRDLPARGRRLFQTAEGYRATVVGGQVTYMDGRHTGALPGRLVRGPRALPT